MATPVGDSYSCVSGGVISGGRFRWPAWRRSMSPYECASVGNTPESINPYLDPMLNPLLGSSNAPWNGSTIMQGNRFHTVVANWCGGAWDDDSGQLYCSGGGHGDYGGNEIISINMLSDSPVWELRAPPTGSTARTWSGWSPIAGILDDGQESSHVYPDGRQRSVHTYNNMLFCEGRLWMGGGSQFRVGSNAVHAMPWNPVTNDYDGPINKATINVQNSYGMYDYDPLRRRIYRNNSGNSGIHYFDIATATWGNLANTTRERGVGSRGLYDSKRDIIIQKSGWAVNIFEVIDLGRNRATATATISGVTPAIDPRTTYGWNDRSGFVYYEPWDCYLIYTYGSLIYRLDPPPVGAADYTVGWVMSEITPTSGSFTLPQPLGTYGRFWASARLKCCGVINATTESMHVIALE